jgi:superfamily II DNA helicase RecQ
VICTNRQLAFVARHRPQSLAKLGEIDGFGRGKVERYGSEMVTLLRKERPIPEAEPAVPHSGSQNEKHES